jgi:hypothetical protein
MQSVRVKFQYGKQEYVKAIQEYLIAAKILRRVDFFVIFIIFFLSVGYMLKFGKNSLSVTMLALSAFIAFMLLKFYFINPMMTWNKTPKLKEEYSLTFSEADIAFKTVSVNTKLNWNIYKKYLETRNFYFLLMSRQQYTIIPKRAFKSPEKQRAFENIIKLKMKKTRE